MTGWRDLGFLRGVAAGLGNLGKTALLLGDVEAADRYISERRALPDAEEGPRDVLLGLGRHDDAMRLLTDALARRHGLNLREDVAVSLECVALALADDEAPLAAELLGAAESVRARFRLPVPPSADVIRQAAVAAALQAIGSDAFARACASGRGAPLTLMLDRARDAASAS